MVRKIILLIAAYFFFSCGKKDKLPLINDLTDLDGEIIVDSSLITPELFLLSAAITSPTADDLQKPVVITVHGFSASNFEWQELGSYLKPKNVLVSKVLLGGHGRNYEAFRKATWTDWQQPILNEYDKLVRLGYTNVNFVASSTGCPLVLDLVRSGKISLEQVHNIVFVDPIIVPSNKQLSLAPLVGGTVIHYTESGLDEGEHGYWYKYRPQEALKELNDLTKKMRKDLEKGIILPDHIKTLVYKSEHDGSADPVSAVLLEKGLRNCSVTIVASQLHVFTRLKARPTVTEADSTLQKNTFEEISEIIQK